MLEASLLSHHILHSLRTQTRSKSKQAASWSPISSRNECTMTTWLRPPRRTRSRPFSRTPHSRTFQRIWTRRPSSTTSSKNWADEGPSSWCTRCCSRAGETRISIRVCSRSRDRQTRCCTNRFTSLGSGTLRWPCFNRRPPRDLPRVGEGSYND